MVMKKKIYFNVPDNSGHQISNLQNIKKIKTFSAGGDVTKKCEKWLIKNIKCKEALLVHSCTAALEMCALLLNIKKGDEIIMPSYTFVSTANAFVLRGGIPVFVDIDNLTCNIDPKKVENKINKKTKAIVVVHYAGISCDMDKIIKIAKKNNVYIVEDAAQSILSYYKTRPLGSIGDLATFSFHETKNIHCGQGGALLINNSKFIKRAKIIRDKGTNRDLFKKNIVKKYTWVDYGSSYALTEILSMFLIKQLYKAKSIINHRISIFNEYHKLLKNLEEKNNIVRPFLPKYSNHNGHIYFLYLKNKTQRDSLINHLKSKSIDTAFHYVPLHTSNFGKKKIMFKQSLPNTEKAYRSIIRLPMHSHMSKNNVRVVVNEIKNFFKIN